MLLAHAPNVIVPHWGLYKRTKSRIRIQPSMIKEEEEEEYRQRGAASRTGGKHVWMCKDDARRSRKFLHVKRSI